MGTAKAYALVGLLYATIGAATMLGFWGATKLCEFADEKLSERKAQKK